MGRGNEVRVSSLRAPGGTRSLRGELAKDERDSSYAQIQFMKLILVCLRHVGEQEESLETRAERGLSSRANSNGIWWVRLFGMSLKALKFGLVITVTITPRALANLIVTLEYPFLRSALPNNVVPTSRCALASSEVGVRLQVAELLSIAS